MPREVWDEVTYLFPNFKVCRFEVWERISNFFAHFIMDVITYPCWAEVHKYYLREMKNLIEKENCILRTDVGINQRD